MFYSDQDGGEQNCHWNDIDLELIFMRDNRNFS